MAAQQALWAETIIAMKKARARADDGSESDNSIKHVSNRGNKLKRKAKFVQEGHLGLVDGPRVYKRKINYNNYDRYIISYNPPRVDPDGDVIDDEDVDSNLDLTDAEEDPYKDVKIEELLKPLTSAADLHKHPSLSVPYTAKHLEEMIQNAQEMVHRERESLYKLKHLLTRFNRDATWIPCGEFDGDEDVLVFSQPAKPNQSGPSSATTDWDFARLSHTRVDETRDMLRLADANETVGSEMGAQVTLQTPRGAELIQDTNGQSAEHVMIQNDGSDPNDVSMRADSQTLADANGDVQVAAPLIHQSHVLEASVADVALADMKVLGTGISKGTGYSHTLSNGDTSLEKEHAVLGEDNSTSTTVQNNVLNENDDTGLGNGKPTAIDDRVSNSHHDTIETSPPPSDKPAHRMTTRARAAQPSPPESSETPSNTIPSPSPAIHPFFLPPTSSLPSSSALFCLPSPFLQETTKLLLAYVQQQEEVVRVACKLHEGLLKALRLREKVWRACRAEGHVGEMSDGEDWIDNEEWGFAEGEVLRKGEEVDEEEVGTSGKKTRNRRAAAV